jgi:para-nitrobenzyl esterase
VTVFGESAGAASVAMLMVMPVAAGLFHRGIAESVPAFLFGSDLAAEVATIVAERLGLRASAGDLAGVPPQALADAIAGTPLRSRWCSAHWIRRSAHCFMARRRQPWPCLAK